MRRSMVLAGLGLAIGWATLAAGQDGDESLYDELVRLQEAAVRAMPPNWHEAGEPTPRTSGLEFEVLHVGDLVHGTPDYVPPQPWLQLDKDSEAPLFGGIAEEAPQPFGTIEELMELVRVSIRPEAWETGVINALPHRLLLLQRPPVIAEVRAFLDDRLRPAAHASVVTEARVVAVPEAVAARPDVVAGQPLAPEAAAALAAAQPEEIVTLRVTSLPGQRAVVWHGRQIAFHSEADVEVAGRARISDPIVETGQAGASLAVRAEAGEDPSVIQLALEFWRNELKLPVRRRKTRDAGELDLPEFRTWRVEEVLRVPAGTWVVAAADGGQWLLVRARHLPLKEAE